MKYLKKIFESTNEMVDTQSLHDILLEITDAGFGCSIETRWINSNINDIQSYVDITINRSNLLSNQIIENEEILKSCVERIIKFLENDGYINFNFGSFKFTNLVQFLINHGLVEIKFKKKS